jgi:hypothetical protein
MSIIEVYLWYLAQRLNIHQLEEICATISVFEKKPQ